MIFGWSLPGWIQNKFPIRHTYLSGVDRCSRRAKAYSHCLPCTVQAVASTRVPSVLLDGIIYDRPLRRLRPSVPTHSLLYNIKQISSQDFPCIFHTILTMAICKCHGSVGS